MVRIAALVLAVLALVATPAGAVPGDEVQQPVSPANGATLPAGQPVSLVFTCPPYRQSPSEEQPSDRFVGYGVTVATDAGLTQTLPSDVVRGPGPGQCTAVPRPSGSSAPLSAPGTYWWRVDRSCFCSGADSESGPVSTFTIAAPQSSMTLGAPKRPYAGYAFAAELRSDLPDDTVVALERGGGDRWARVRTPATVRTLEGEASVPVTVGRARTGLRFVVVEGPQAGQTSKPVAVAGRPARRWSTGRRADGRYAQSGKLLTTFRVAKRGRELRDFRAQVSTFCIGGLDPATNRVVTSLAIVKRIRVAPDGRFLAVTRVSETDIVVRGRLRGRRVQDGRVSIAYPLCSGAREFTARRR